MTEIWACLWWYIFLLLVRYAICIGNIWQVKHLGNLLQVYNIIKMDLGEKRGKFIGRATSLLDHELLTRIMNIFTTSFYGSKSWNVAMSHVWKFGFAKLSLNFNFGFNLTTSASACFRFYANFGKDLSSSVSFMMK